MPEINWADLPLFEIKKPLDVTELWLTVVETIRDASLIRISAEGDWDAMGRLLAPCGPAGHPNLKFVADQLLVPDAPAGALIGRFGGSSASIAAPVPPPPTPAPGAAPPAPIPSPADGKPFAIGTLCILAIPAHSVGPLFVGFNGNLRPVHVRHLKIMVSTATPTV